MVSPSLPESTDDAMNTCVVVLVNESIMNRLTIGLHVGNACPDPKQDERRLTGARAWRHAATQATMRT
jgi:hypothetical protein